MRRPVFSRNVGSSPFALSSSQNCGGAAVLPDDRVVDGLAVLVPDDRCLALVGDADRGDVVEVGAGVLQRCAGSLELGFPDLVGVVLDPSGVRVVLLELALGDRRGWRLSGRRGWRGRRRSPGRGQARNPP